MNLDKIKDEYLERIWYLAEEDKLAMDEFRKAIGEAYDEEIMKGLISEGLVKISWDKKNIAFTGRGEGLTRQLIRSHRLAERMVHDVLGGEFETGACEFEHIVNSELVDSICILLGHPRECPHGMPIPEGECCRNSITNAESQVHQLTRLKVGESARVAYINCRDDGAIHKMDGLHIRPGVLVKLHQDYPAYVIECEGANIAIDEEIASSICVWKKKDPDKDPTIEEEKRHGRRLRLRLGRGK